MKALLISEDTEVSQHIEQVIKNNFKNVELISASNSEETMSVASSDGPFGFIFLDVDSKKMDSSEIAQDLLDFIGERPFIFFGSEGIIKSKISDELYNSTEYNSFLFKPLMRDDFLSEFKEIINKVKTWIKKEHEASASADNDPDDYVEMKLRSFYLYNSFKFDVHMKITPSSFMKLLEAEKDYSHSILSQYAKKGIKKLYLLKDDQMKFLESEANYCLRAMAAPVSKEDLSQVYLIHLRSITVFHQILNAIGPTSLCSNLLDKLIESIIAQKKASYSFKDLLKNYPAGFGSVASKSLLTAFFALELAHAMEWDSDTTQIKLVAASALQDYSLPEEELTWITDKNDPRLVEYDSRVNAEFLAHPKKAADMAALFSKYSDIDFILSCHEEIPNREGFPNRPSLTSLTKVNAVFNIGQAIAARVDGSPIKAESLNNALKSMYKPFNFGVFKEPLKKMEDIFKFN